MGQNSDNIELGDKVRDIITGFEGIVIGHTRYITGCDQFLVNPAKVNKEGALPESHWFDQDRLDLITKGELDAARVTQPQKAQREPVRRGVDVPAPAK